MTSSVPLDVSRVPSPSYVLEETALRHNLAIFDRVQRESGAKIILALKGFAFWNVFPWVREVLQGATASSLHEAKLAHEEFGRETHVYSVAYTDEEFPEILGMADHLVFNSFSQWKRFRGQVLASGRAVECGIRVNPGYSEIKTPLHDPCYTGSRLGVLRSEFLPEELERWFMPGNSPVASLSHFRPVLQLSETPPRWVRPTVLPGHDAPVWPLRHG